MLANAGLQVILVERDATHHRRFPQKHSRRHPTSARESVARKTDKAINILRAAFGGSTTTGRAAFAPRRPPWPTGRRVSASEPLTVDALAPWFQAWSGLAQRPWGAVNPTPATPSSPGAPRPRHRHRDHPGACRPLLELGYWVAWAADQRQPMLLTAIPRRPVRAPCLIAAAGRAPEFLLRPPRQLAGAAA